MSKPSEFTTGEIAKQLDAQRYSIEYIIDSRSIEPTRRLGITRLFDDAAFAQIEAALHEIQARREAVAESHTKSDVESCASCAAAP